MEKYKLLIKPSALKEIEAIGQKQDRRRIIDCISTLADNPRPTNCEKLSGTRNLYRIRTGRYRIVYTVNDTEIIVQIVKVGHRKDVYKFLD